MTAAVGRNDICPCGSGKKFKHCCALKRQRTSWGSRVTFAVVGLILLGGAIVMLASLDELDDARVGPARVWSEEHQHWH
jgi:hypothetical protein